MATSTDTYDYDLLVIGAGSGGVRASRMAAAAGQKVAVVESQYLGGTCVNVGCVPKKLLVYASHFRDEFDDAAGFGWHVPETTHSWATLIDNKNREIERLNGIYRNLLTNAGVDIIHGWARFESSNTVSVNDKTYTAEKVLIAVGGTPVMPEIPGIEHAISSNEAFYLEACPKKIVIVGGGYIAVEFAGIFHGLGVETHLVYRGTNLLRHFDRSTADFVTEQMKLKGIHIHFGNNVNTIQNADGELHCEMDVGDPIAADAVMFATGRKPLVDGLGLENTRVSLTDNGVIKTDARFQTTDSAIFALGDVIGTPELTPVALAQAMVFVDQQYGEDRRVMDYSAIPTTIFSQPNLATVGYSEQQVRELGLKADVYTSDFRHLKHTLTQSQDRVYMKMLVEKGSDKILGVHMAGPDAGEIIQGFAVVVKAGLTKAQIDATIGIHPTAAEELVTLRQVNYSIE